MSETASVNLVWEFPESFSKRICILGYWDVNFENHKIVIVLFCVTIVLVLDNCMAKTLALPKLMLL